METSILSSDEISVLELMEKFFRAYPPEKAERIFWELLFLQGDYEFNMLPEETIREFSDFINKMAELERAVEQLENDGIRQN